MSVAEIVMRPLLPQRIPDVSNLEQAASAFPWTEKMYADSLDAGYWGGTLCQGTQLLGVAVVSSAVGESHLLNMFIALGRQGQGFGRLLLKGACQHACDAGSDKMFLEVRAGNGRAINLYRSVGFQQIGIRKDYYPGPLDREDAVCMALNLSEYILEC